MTDVVASFRRERFPAALFLGHAHVFVASVYDDHQGFVRALETGTATGRAQGIGGIVQRIENVVLAVAVRVHFRFALFLRCFLVFAFRTAGTGTGLGVDERFHVLRLVYSLVFRFGAARFRFEIDFVAALADFLVHYALLGAEFGDLFQIALAQFAVVFA